MDMTKFASNQDQDYQNVLSELRRFIPSREAHPDMELISATSQSSPNQETSQSENRNEESSANKRGQAGKREESGLRQPPQPVIHFSGTFNTGGGKSMQGNQFNAGGGAMNF
jgi:hypothetical protein